MNEYPKIETLLNRDEKFKVIDGQWRLPEFDYLKNNKWLFTEKIDGTNIRVMWNGQALMFGGKTDNAQIPTFLLTRLKEIFPISKLVELYPGSDHAMCLYGEGFGAKIQGGGKYLPTGQDFILFDVKVGEWWLERENIEDVANKLAIMTVPIIGIGSLSDAIHRVKTGYNSTFGAFPAEGIVVRPPVTLFTHKGERLLGKIKTKDF